LVFFLTFIYCRYILIDITLVFKLPLALLDINNRPWAIDAYEKVTLGIGGDLGFGIEAKAGVGLLDSVKPIVVGLECNLGAFCEDTRGKKIDNVYKFVCGNKFEIKGGASIPNPYIATAGVDIALGFPLKTFKVRLKTDESLFL